MKERFLIIFIIFMFIFYSVGIYLSGRFHERHYLIHEKEEMPIKSIEVEMNQPDVRYMCECWSIYEE